MPGQTSTAQVSGLLVSLRRAVMLMGAGPTCAHLLTCFWPHTRTHAHQLLGPPLKKKLLGPHAHPCSPSTSCRTFCSKKKLVVERVHCIPSLKVPLTRYHTSPPSLDRFHSQQPVPVTTNSIVERVLLMGICRQRIHHSFDRSSLAPTYN